MLRTLTNHTQGTAFAASYRENETTTKHTHTVVFGRKVDGCPRCEELKAGAAPVVWNRSNDYARKIEIRRHVCTPRCGPVCTHGDW